ncbi:cytochrome P450 [Epithele typhae]|uniref:cytochrome P450 n=1 Tax=Epithele typhae TaxID=378194 RepID=UPI0020088752|nr:cytochrome P450 [Epithele typhae]KAH9937809.1 cytochrome P450 [Epithele typhae]
MSLSPITVPLGLVLIVFVALRRKARTLPLPPGPRPLPLIGNVLDMPKTDISAALRDMSAVYGDIMYLNLLGRHLIVLGSQEAAIDLLEKRSTNYSDRVPSPMIRIAGLEWALALQPYGSWWRRHRRALHQYFSPAAVAQYAASQKLEAHRFVRRLVDTPDDLVSHIGHLFGSSLLRVTYGIEIDDEETDYLKMGSDALAVFSDAFTAGKYLVEFFPVLKYLPSWMPGAEFKREGAEWTQTVNKLLTVPWNATMDAMRKGTARPSMATGLMESVEEMPDADAAEEEDIYRNSTAVAYAAGADTSASTIQTFFMAMTLFPEVQKKAQAELMAVVGPHRLPEKEDAPSLPYVHALVKEFLRWRPAVPLNLPHCTLEEDEYRGYRIPKGSMVIANNGGISFDEKFYPDPDRFMPERFLTAEGQLNPDVLDPATFVFGFGRRICPGLLFAETSLFMIVASVLHTLTISAPVDANGKPILPSGKMTDGQVAYPEPFRCVIKPASAERESLVRASCVELNGVRAVQ